MAVSYSPEDYPAIIAGALAVTAVAVVSYANAPRGAVMWLSTAAGLTIAFFIHGSMTDLTGLYMVGVILMAVGSGLGLGLVFIIAAGIGVARSQQRTQRA